ncbi:MAG: GAF domain-containing protein [Chitinivibrionales bacterium]|nr:GAF domain-containing protein [Chitinivibrionales bacterium]
MMHFRTRHSMQTTNLIYLLGSVPAADRSLLEIILNRIEVEGCFVDVSSLEAIPQFSTPPLGFFSYLDDSQDTLIKAFGALPIGTGRDIPFFQLSSNSKACEARHSIPVTSCFASPLSELPAEAMLSQIANNSEIVANNRQLRSEIVRYRNEKSRILQIASALSAVNDLDSLLELFLTRSRELVNADAGSIYIRELTSPGGAFGNSLRFKIAQNDSIDVSLKSREFVIPISQETICGYVAQTGKPLSLDDVYTLDGEAPYAWQRHFDLDFKYRTKSMLTVPLKNLKSEVVGIMQLMNRKKDFDTPISDQSDIEEQILSFSRSDEELVLSVASLAATSIERALLYNSIQNLFEGFANSAAAAIDERDRVTAGHSKRVMGYALALADAMSEDSRGPFREMHFDAERKRRLRYAALLHDFGKIGVPEKILTKESRLSQAELDFVKARAGYIRLYLRTNQQPQLSGWQTEAEVDADVALIDSVNRIGFIKEDVLASLQRIRVKTFVDIDGSEKPFITTSEWEHLSVRKGNLTTAEREILNSHADGTFRLLARIPWTRELEDIPDIACHHHEKLDGSGYPDGLTDKEIPLESRLLAVIDIYEALVAQDRPYKPKIEPTRAARILREEVAAGHLDGDIVEFFLNKNIHLMFYHT